MSTERCATPAQMRLAILSVSLLTIMAGATVTPALGRIALAFPDAAPVVVRLVITLPALTIIPMSLLAGRLTLIWPRRRLLFAGLALYAGAGMGGALAGSMAVLLATRAVFGVGVGIVLPMASGLIADFYRGEERAAMMGYSTAVSNLGAIVATLIGGWVATMSWRYTFFVYGLALPVWLLTALCLPEPPHEERAESEVGDPAGLPGAVYALAAGMVGLMLFFYVIPANLAIFLLDEGIGDADLAGAMNGVLTLSAMAFALSYGRLRQLVGPYISALGALAMAVGMTVMSRAQAPAGAFAALVVVGLGMGTLPTVLRVEASQRVPPWRGAQAMAVLSSGIYVGQFLSPLVVGGLASLLGASLRYHFALSAGAFGVAAVALIVVARQGHITQ